MEPPLKPRCGNGWKLCKAGVESLYWKATNKRGSSNLLVDEFIRGAQESGRIVEVIDATPADLHPCTGCVHCGYEAPCIRKDDMEPFRKQYYARI